MHYFYAYLWPAAIAVLAAVVFVPWNGPKDFDELKVTFVLVSFGVGYLLIVQYLLGKFSVHWPFVRGRVKLETRSWGDSEGGVERKIECRYEYEVNGRAYRGRLVSFSPSNEAAWFHQRGHSVDTIVEGEHVLQFENVYYLPLAPKIACLAVGSRSSDFILQATICLIFLFACLLG